MPSSRNQHNQVAATPTTNETILFKDPLTSNANGWLDSNGRCYFQDQAYHIKDYICYAPVGDISDANITVQAKQVAGPLIYPYGIVFRLDSSSRNWYEFDITSNSHWLFRKVLQGVASLLVPYTPNAAIKGGLNTTNTLRVQAKGTHFVFFVNGTKVGEAVDTDFSNGLAALCAVGIDTQVEVAYNNFEITAA